MSFLAPILVAALAFAQAPPQEPTLQTLFEAGQYGPVIERVAGVEAPAPQDLYLAGQSARRLDPPDNEQARNLFRRLEGADTDAWTFISRSAVAIVDDQPNDAIPPAQQAVTLAPESFYAQYQLGLAYAESRNFADAATALEKATTMDPAFAYAQYYAGQAYYQIRRIDKMAAFFGRFLKLAPNAPERPAIESLMRSIRGK